MRIIQLTDCHLFDDPAARLGGVDTQRTLAAVIDALARADPAHDVVLATGDLTQLGEAGAYGRVMSSNYNLREVPPEISI